MVFNRVQREALAGGRRLDEAWLRELVGSVVKRSGHADRLVENFLDYEMQTRGDQVRMEAFRRLLPARTVVAAIPNFDEDLHDIAGLRRMIPHFLAA